MLALFFLVKKILSSKTRYSLSHVFSKCAS
jgi:hypothetical protein